MKLLRCYLQAGTGILLVFGSAAIFNVILLVFFPIRKRMGPLLIQILSKAFLVVTNTHITFESRIPIFDPHHPTLILSNHLSFLDIPVLSAAFRTVFVSKKEVRLWPFLGFLGVLSGIIFLDRGHAGRRVSLLKRLAAELEPGTVTAVFPQGTTSTQAEDLPFLRGIFKVVELNPSIRLLPVTLKYLNEEGVAWGGEALFTNALKVLSHRRIRVRITTHDPVTISHYNDKSAREVAVAVEKTVKAPLLQSSLQGQ